MFDLNNREKLYDSIQPWHLFGQNTAAAEGEAIRAAALALGSSDFFVKPVDFDRLQNALAKYAAAIRTTVVQAGAKNNLAETFGGLCR